MIRRDLGEKILLITQHDHALLAGRLLQHIGNAVFAPPSPFKPVYDAVSHHDFGWKTHDQIPVLNAGGRPAHVFEITHTIALAAWAESIAAAAAGDPYSGLLVSLHAMNLAAGAAISAGRLSAADESARRDLFLIQKFLQSQAELQESLRRRLGMRIDLPLHGGLAEPGQSDDDDLLRANFHLLQMLDQLSLVLCFDRLVFDRVANVRPRSMGETLTMRIDRPGAGKIRIDPWPFDIERLDLHIPARVLPNRAYRDPADISAALSAAKPEQIEVQLVNWHKI